MLTAGRPASAGCRPSTSDVVARPESHYCRAVRVICWNMNGRTRAWDFLLEQVDWDVALLQEAKKPPASLVSECACVWRPKYAASRSGASLWGTAVVRRDGPLEPFEPDARFPWLRELAGSTAIAKSPDEPRWLASVHLHASPVGLEALSRISTDGVELTTRRRKGSVWEQNVVPFEFERLFAGDTYIWGGDLNTDPRMDDIPAFAGGNRRLFQVYAEAGFHDTRAPFHADYQRTFFTKRSGPYQLDHVFADSETAARVAAWQIDERPVSEASRQSDHAPILVEIAENASAAQASHVARRESAAPVKRFASGASSARAGRVQDRPPPPASEVTPVPAHEGLVPSLCRGWTAHEIVAFVQSANETQARFLAYVASHPRCTTEDLFEELGITYCPASRNPHALAR